MRTALVLGGADCLWSDVEAALNLGSYAGVVACNDAAAAWPGQLDAMVSLHAEQMGQWIGQRNRAEHPAPRKVIGHTVARSGIVPLPDGITDFVEYRFQGQIDTGSSGLFALKVALIDLGFDRAVVCGAPLVEMPHFFDALKWGGALAHRRGWIQALPQIKDRARSMSGWTGETLGRPTKEWLG